MATVQNPGIPRVKLESALDGNVKHEQMDVEMTSPYTDDGDDGLEDGGDLDFTNAQQQLWLASIPRTLWSEWSGIGLDEEIEIGTIRVEGPPDNPQRISLKLNSRGASDIEHKEYNLRPLPNQQSPIERPGQALIFSEQDLPGYKAKPFAWEQVDEDGNPGQGRSQLYEKHKRDQQKKENPDRFEPYKRKPIPKKTALAGTVVRDLQAEPVKNGDYERVEEIKANMIFGASKQREKTQIFTSKAAMAGERTAGSSIMATTEQRRAANKASQERKNRLQEGRGVEMPEADLRALLHQLFGQYKAWRFRELKAKTRQPDDYLRTVLAGIAFKHSSGDFRDAWELTEYEKKMSGLVAATNDLAPELAGQEDDEDEDDAVAFIDALPDT